MTARGVDSPRGVRRTHAESARVANVSILSDGDRRTGSPLLLLSLRQKVLDDDRNPQGLTALTPLIACNALFSANRDWSQQP